MSFERIASVADAVLLEGYVLYPYRPTSAKNQYRWTFGVLAPRAWSEDGGCERWWLEAQSLVEGDSAVIHGRLRFLRVVGRRVERRDGESWTPVDRLDVDGRSHVSWEEGDITEIDFAIPGTTTFALEAAAEIEALGDVGRVVRERAAIAGRIDARLEGEGPLRRLVVRASNLTDVKDTKAPRAEAVRSSLVSAHLLFHVEDGAFVSVIDPPEAAREAAASCTSVATTPVLAGPPGQRDLLLCSPIILYDHPAIAPESPGDFYDASEIDELLALRTRTLTPEERALARATDRRAAEIVDRALSLSEDQLTRLHGAVRDRPAATFAVGSRVRLRPDERRRRTDAQDLLFAGRSATVEGIRHDVDGREYLLVTLDDDPGAELARAKGRFHFYYPDEVERL